MLNPKLDKPYQELGNLLKDWRIKSKETLLEVSNAVEIDAKVLEKIELGLDRPTEDILILLINHFRLKDNDALILWKMAQYDDNSFFESHQFEPVSINNIASNTSLVMVMPIDIRPLYSDQFDILVGTSGIVMNFNQSLVDNQILPVARIGVSFEQASNIIKSLEMALLKVKYNSGPKKLNSTNESIDSK